MNATRLPQELINRLAYRIKLLILIYYLMILLVGTAGFEPATPCPPDKYATRLRYAPTHCINDTTRPYYKSKSVLIMGVCIGLSDLGCDITGDFYA